MEGWMKEQKYVYMCRECRTSSRKKIALIQSLSKKHLHTVATASVSDLQDTSSKDLPNGMYTLRHNFHVNLTRADNGTTFRYQNIHFIPNLGITRSQDTAMVFVNCEYQSLIFEMATFRYPLFLLIFIILDIVTPWFGLDCCTAITFVHHPEYFELLHLK